MILNEINDVPDILMEFLEYHSTIKGHSDRTIAAYYTDLKILFRFLKQRRHLVPRGTPFNEIDITDIDIDFIKTIKIEELYRYQSFSPDYNNSTQTLSAASRCRRTSSVKSFFKYLSVKRHLLDQNICLELDMPKRPSTLPRYLEEEECERLLAACNGPYMYRDYCILMLFISCGLRISELVSINIHDIYDDHIRVLGKGNKERIVFFADGCREAIDDYLAVRNDEKVPDKDKDALFLSQKNCRFGVRGVQQMVEKKLKLAGLDATRYSPHKLRHTAATLMLKNGVDTRALQEVLGHSNLNTTQIYTHLDNAALHEAAMANPIGRKHKADIENE
ncbi:MAG: tyrosine-type recombinase/integrase [Oscillospiraceae bacterium]|nr:tyrosine-type recombinase/integrase [Oscillospiraceae bacterium]